MGYRSTRELTEDLHLHGRLLVVEDEVDPHLEIAEIHRRVYRNGGPGLLFTRVRGTHFPVATNLFGSLERARFIFRDTLELVALAIRIKLDHGLAWKQVWRLPSLVRVASNMRPRKVRTAAVQFVRCPLSRLPRITCWPEDGGAFVTLPQVLSQSCRAAASKHFEGLNLGMYRVQLNGNEYQPDRECGLHYQIQRGIGVHHQEAISAQRPFQVNITVGGSPAMTLAAVMPLPESMSEVTFAGALAGHRIPMVCQSDAPPLYADADFAICGVVQSQLKLEGPFGDHLGYYAGRHPFPVLNVQNVWHRRDAVWPMTVVGRPPQEDTTFGDLIHELTGPVIPAVLPGVKQVHAVDAAGVHPLLLAIGSERYTPYQPPHRPQELLTQASAILGQGQLSLAKYVWIANQFDALDLDATQVAVFFQHVLRRVRWQRDLHFHTCTTIDTLDYSGDGLNEGSKLVVAASGSPIRELPTAISNDLRLPDRWRGARMVLPGILAVSGPPVLEPADREKLKAQLDQLPVEHPLAQWPLVVIVDDCEFTSRQLENFLWVTFTRSNPAVDVHGIGAFVRDKHFGCMGNLVIDARAKPHHARPLYEDKDTLDKVDARATRGDALARYL